MTDPDFIEQGKTIGIIGGGQLGQMMALSAKYGGMKVITLDPTPNCPCGQVADKQIVAEYSDVKAIEELAKESDVLTYEFENVDLNALKDVADYWNFGGIFRPVFLEVKPAINLRHIAIDAQMDGSFRANPVY